MQITLSFDNFTELPYTSGTVQNISSQATVEICQDDTANTGLILGPGEWFSWSNSTIYARSAWDYEPTAICAVVPFKKGGEGGGSEYILPVATNNTLGGVKSSDEAGAIKVDSSGKMTYNAPSSTPLSAPDWETNTAYPENALVEYGDNIYICLIAHTSGTFADDLANGKWKLVSMTLTAATSSELGGVKSNSADGGVTVDSNGKMTINLPKATSSILGGVKIGDGLSVAADGTLSATGGTSIDEWTSGNTYAVDDFVTHQNLLYKCTTANSDSAWTPAHWQKIGDVNFTGATSSENGTNGLVPPPTTSDISKFLCGDGTWKYAVAGVQAARVTLWEGSAGSLSGSGNVSLNLSDSVNNYDKLGVTVVFRENSYDFIRYYEVTKEMLTASESNMLPFGFSSSGSYIGVFKATSSNVISIDYVNAKTTKITGIKYIQSDSYSTEEKLIGTWIDGKPLYRKVFENVVNNTNTSLTSSVVKIVKLYGCVVDGDGTISMLPNTGTELYIVSSSGVIRTTTSRVLDYVVIEYTKN